MEQSITESWILSQFSEIEGVVSLKNGGQKYVFSAKHSSYGDVVLKIYKDGDDVERMKREIIAAQALKKYRVPEIFATGTCTHVLETLVWVIERKLDGETLCDKIARSPLTSSELLHLALQLLETLREAEKLHIVHRDVKPDNIFVDTDGNFWLIDFGFARHLDMNALTRASYPYGPCTPGYSPPEQFRNQQASVDGRADLFALAVTVYEAATGSHPYRSSAATIDQVFKNVEAKDVPLVPMSGKHASDFQDLISCMGKRHQMHRPKDVEDAYQWMLSIINQ